MSRCETDINAVARSYLFGAASNEPILGMYRGDSKEQDIVFTAQSLIFFDAKLGALRKLSYADIAQVEFPLPTSESTSLLLRVHGGSELLVNVVGQQGKFRDVYETGRYLMRVAEDARAL